MRKLLMTCLLAGMTVCLPAARVRAETLCKVYRVNTAIKTDGVMDEEAWRHLPTVTGFIYTNQRDEYSALQTAFQAGYDDDALYLGIRAEEPKIAEHLAHAREKDTGEANWEYQMIEVFLDVPSDDGTRQPYQFALDILGHSAAYRADLQGRPFSTTDTKWHKADVPWQGAVRCGSDHFVMEIAFPFTSLGVRPRNCDVWGFQIGRHGTWAAGVLEGLHWKVACWTAWAPMPSGKWRSVDEHGALEFVDEVLLADAQNVGKKTEEINRNYYQWKATHGEAVRKVQALARRTEGRVDLCYGEGNTNTATCLVFGQQRGPPPRGDVPNWTWLWWFAHTGNPQTATLEWAVPVTFNCNKIEWYSPTQVGREYALEYWTGSAWKLAYRESANTIPLSCHAFPAVTTQRARLTIARVSSDTWNFPLRGFALYRIPDEEAGAGD